MFWRRSDERLLEYLMQQCDTETVDTQEGVQFRRPTGVIRAVVKELRYGEARMSPAQILAIFMMIMDIMAVVGPFVADIVREIRNRRQ